MEDSYRGGEVSGHEIPTLIKALLLVSIDKDCPGAARYVNGDWSEIDLVMPLLTLLVPAVGWSSYAMGHFLSLCERAGAAYPFEAFAEQTQAVVNDIENAKGSWSGTLLPARIAGVIQNLSDSNYPLQPSQTQALLRILDALVDLGDRRSAALEQAETFRRVRVEGV
ncbi:MAG: hypothetical protein AAFY34_11190 [Pseudomonadota bacterium]